MAGVSVSDDSAPEALSPTPSPTLAPAPTPTLTPAASTPTPAQTLVQRTETPIASKPKQWDCFNLTGTYIRISAPTAHTMTHGLLLGCSKTKTRSKFFPTTSVESGADQDLNLLMEEGRYKNQELYSEVGILCLIAKDFFRESAPIASCSIVPGKNLPEYCLVKCKLAEDLMKDWSNSRGMEVIEECYKEIVSMDKERTEYECTYLGHACRFFPIYKPNKFDIQGLESFVAMHHREIQLFIQFRQKAFDKYKNTTPPPPTVQSAPVSILDSAMRELEICASINGVLAGEWARLPVPPAPPRRRTIENVKRDMDKLLYDCLWLSNRWYRAVTTISGMINKPDGPHISFIEVLQYIGIVTLCVREVRSAISKIVQACFSRMPPGTTSSMHS